MVTTSADYDVILMDLQMPVMNGLLSFYIHNILSKNSLFKKI